MDKKGEFKLPNNGRRALSPVAGGGRKDPVTEEMIETSVDGPDESYRVATRENSAGQKRPEKERSNMADNETCPQCRAQGGSRKCSRCHMLLCRPLEGGACKIVQDCVLCSFFPAEIALAIQRDQHNGSEFHTAEG